MQKCTIELELVALTCSPQNNLLFQGGLRVLMMIMVDVVKTISTEDVAIANNCIIVIARLTEPA